MKHLRTTRVHDFLEAVGEDFRFREMEATLVQSPKLVEVNFEKLRCHFEKWLRIAYEYWDQLDALTRRRTVGYIEDSEGAVLDGCKALSILMIEELHTFLAWRAQKRLGRDRTAQLYGSALGSFYREIPEGCA